MSHKITSYIYSSFSKTETITLPETTTIVITSYVTVQTGSTKLVTLTETITSPALIPRDDQPLELEYLEKRQLPVGIPSWASNCKSKAGTEAAFRFSSACSCFFRTTSLPPVTMETVTTTASVTQTFTETSTSKTTILQITSTPVTTVVNIVTQTKIETLTVSASTSDTTSTPTSTAGYYVKVIAGQSGDDAFNRTTVLNDTYVGWYFTSDTRFPNERAFTLTQTRDQAIVFEFETPEVEYRGNLAYRSGEELFQLTVQQGLGSSLYGAYKQPLPADMRVLNYEIDGNNLYVYDQEYGLPIYFDYDLEKYDERKAGLVWITGSDFDNASPGDGTTILWLAVEPVLPES
ncbi:uncharacterized protein DFL_003988 [Arthrobotrys flagrans]|uniref:Uncharacterized protein n=1 Tax=Arthrobotrys flagrans TaxID=97331 RepID=A0A437A3Q8_ARTFL|nr:hypothetical protein DFL_003988 [Arthrobotrys flagrans]